MNQKQVSTLIAQLDTQSDYRAGEIISKMLNFKSIAGPMLVKAAKGDPSPLVRKWSLNAIGVLGYKRGAPLLVRALQDPRMTVRLHAIKGLANMKHTKACKNIAECLSDFSGGIRVNALEALLFIGGEEFADEFMNCLNDQKWYVRQKACEACGKLKLQSSEVKLKKLAKSDSKKAVREAAIKALSQIKIE